MKKKFRRKFNCRYILLLIAILLSWQIAMSQERGTTSVHIGGHINSYSEDTILLNRFIEVGHKVKSISPDSALAILKHAYVLGMKHKMYNKVARVLGLMAANNIRKGDFDSSKKLLDSAFVMAKNIHDGELICFLHTVTAGMYQYSSNYAQASSHYFKALETLKEYHLSASPVLPGLYNNLGALMSLLGEHDFAQKYLLEAQKYALTMKPVDSTILTYILTNLGQMYVDSSLTLSIGYFKKAYRIARLQNDVFFSHHILINLARTYLDQADFINAGKNLEESRAFAVTEPTIELTEALTGYLLLRQKDYSGSLAHLRKALYLGEKNGSKNLDEIYQGLTRWYAEQKEYDSAYHYQRKYMDLYEEEMGARKKAVIDLMLNFQASEQEKRIALKQAELSVKEKAIRRSNIWIITISVFSTMLLFILGIAYRSHLHKQNFQNEKMQTIIQLQEIEKLKAAAEGEERERGRMSHDLHDGVMVRFASVKMNLHVLQSLDPQLAHSQHYKDIIKQFEIATSELRRTAHNLMPESLLEEGLAQAIFYFCKAMEESSGLSIKYQQVGNHLLRFKADFEITVFRIVQELIQNVIKHARATKALVQLNFSENFFSVTIEDNGIGFVTHKEKEGFGLKSIRSRIKMLHGSFDLKSNEGNGTTAYIEFDAQSFLSDGL